MRLIIALLIITSFFGSCASKKEIVYFQQDSLAMNTAFEMQSPKLQTGDILTISVTADDPRVVAPYNQLNGYLATSIQESNPFIPTYVIDKDGYVEFPKLGRVKLAGLTRLEAIDFLRKDISKEVVNPGITIKIVNFQITVIGEVSKPGTFKVDNDRISLLEGLSLAGDLTINGERKNVLVIREENGMKNEYRVDLTKREALNSPVYFLKQNDVVYVEPNGARVQSSKYTQNTSIFVSIAGLIITIIAVIVK